jgi:hypothetical protein
MQVNIPIKICEHLSSISSYNHNYYKLPFDIDGYDVILTICDEYNDSYMYFLGKEKDGQFKNNVDNYFSCIHGFEVCKDYIILDTKYKNKWLT